MPNPVATVERYIGGGKVYFTPYVNGAYGAEFEIGEVQEATVKINPSFVKAFSRDSGVNKQVDQVLSEVTSSILFKTQNVNKENMRIAMLGSLSTETFAIGDTLPDGSVATVETILPVVIGGVDPKIEGKVRIVGVNTTGGDDPVMIVPMAVLTADGDVRSFFASAYAAIGFSGEVFEIDGEYFREYYIPKA